jgi:hypothetical protein
MSISFRAICLMLASLNATAADGIKSPEEQFAGYQTRIGDIPDNWATTRPIQTRVCFNLRYPINSPEANAFLSELHSTISGMEFGVDIRIERPIYPVTHAYCATMLFRDWETNRRYETSEVFLRFYEDRWKAVTLDVDERLSVVDTRAAGED